VVEPGTSIAVAASAHLRVERTVHAVLLRPWPHANVGEPAEYIGHARAPGWHGNTSRQDKTRSGHVGNPPNKRARRSAIVCCAGEETVGDLHTNCTVELPSGFLLPL